MNAEQLHTIESISIEDDIATLAKVAANVDEADAARLERLLDSARQFQQDIDDLVCDVQGKFTPPRHIPAATAADLRSLRGGICPGCDSEYLIETNCEGEPVGACPGLICGTCQWGCAA